METEQTTITTPEAPAVTADSDNYFAKMTLVIGWALIGGGLLLAIFMAHETVIVPGRVVDLEEKVLNPKLLALYYVPMAISGFLLVGLSEVISLLHDIKRKMK